MEFYMHHGRTDAAGPPQQLDADGTPYDVEEDWGFEGPRLARVIGFHCTYGSHCHLYFEDKRAADAAAAVTGWPRWSDESLDVQYSPEGDMVTINDPTFNRPHYFGDWGIK